MMNAAKRNTLLVLALLALGAGVFAIWTGALGTANPGSRADNHVVQELQVENRKDDRRNIVEPPESRREVQIGEVTDAATMNTEVSRLETELKAKEKQRSKVISRVDNEKISHVSILIDAPSSEEFDFFKKKIETLRQTAERLQENEAFKSDFRRLNDYVDFGSSKTSRLQYQCRLLTVDVHHADGERFAGTLSSSVKYEYGTDDSGTPWSRSSGPIKSRALTEEQVASRYGHLVSTRDD